MRPELSFPSCKDKAAEQMEAFACELGAVSDLQSELLFGDFDRLQEQPVLRKLQEAFVRSETLKGSKGRRSSQINKEFLLECLAKGSGFKVRSGGC